MRKLFYILISFAFCFTFINNIYASPEEYEKAKRETEEFCDENASKPGCFYDDNNIMYTQSGSVSNENFYAKLTVASATPLLRGYQAVASNGKIVFAGCYRFEFNSPNAYYFDNGTYFVFKIIEANSNNNCEIVATDIVPAKGIVSRGYGLFDIPVTLSPYDGRNGIGSDSMTFKWTATNGGECPLMFGYTANSRWYTSSANRYLFSDSKDDFTIGSVSFWGRETYNQVPGCTVQDETGYKEAKECFDNAIVKINNYTCPSDMSNIVTMTDALAGYQETCKNKFKLLYSKGLLESQAEEFSNKMKTATTDKINSCYYSKCNISQTSQNKIDVAVAGTECANGCTTKSGTCIECLKTAYNVAGLTQTQKNCLLNNEEEKQGVIEEVTDDIDQQFQDQVEKDIEENKAVRAYIEEHKFDISIPDPGFGESRTTCENLLGRNLTKVVKSITLILRIAGAIIATVNGMIALIPAVVSKDQDALKKATKKCVNMGIVLVLILLLPSLLVLIGNLFSYDISCIV
ncbi:MAG: hypothetical protein GX758_01655 [Tenericutes bacterium]|nr:hypothetical protein [Mycoplasmatota bacterium]